MAPAFPEPGSLFNGKYRVTRLLGAGGFSRVYHAVQEGLGRDVALKILQIRSREEQSAQEQQEYVASVTERFRREARMISQLRCPFTIKVYDYGESADGCLHMVLEYVHGEHVEQLLRREGPVASARAAALLRQVLLSLSEAHALGVLHRDIKPQNIMVFDHMGLPDQVRLLDFGIAKVVGEGEQHVTELTEQGSLLGTARYMAPEQILGDPMGPFTDLYALGLVAHQMLTGRHPIEDTESVRVIGRQLAPTSFVLPAGLDVDPTLRAIVDRLLRKAAAERYQSAAAVLTDLAPLVAGQVGPISGEFALQVPAMASATRALRAGGPIPTPAPWQMPAPPPSSPPQSLRAAPPLEVSTPAAGLALTPQRTMPMTPPASIPTFTPRRPLPVPTPTPTPAASTDDPLPTPTPPTPSLLPRLLIGLGLAMLALAAIAAVAVVALNSDPIPEAQPAPQTTSAPTPAPIPTLHIETAPPGATLTLDGRPIGVSPLTLPREQLPGGALLSADLDGRHAELRLSDSEAEHLLLTLPEPAIEPAQPLPSTPAARPASAASKRPPTSAPVRRGNPEKSNKPGFYPLD